MKTFALSSVVLFLMASCAAPTSVPNERQPAVRDQLALALERHYAQPGRDPAPLDYAVISGVEVSPVRNSNTEFVAITDTEQRWWGTWCFFRLNHGLLSDVVWGDAGNAMVHDLRAFRDSRFPGVLVHVWGRSHRGNGDYQLVQVHEGRARVLLETRAVDSEAYGDGLVLHREMLFATLEDFDGDGIDDLVLEGVQIQICAPEWGDEDPAKWAPVTPQQIRKVFLWNAATRSFQRSAAADIGSFD